MKRITKILVFIAVLVYCAAVQAFDVAYAETKSGILIMTNDQCKHTNPHPAEVKVLQIRHMSKETTVNGCYVLTPDGVITAEFENGAHYKYKLEQFMWTPEAYERLKKLEEDEHTQQAPPKCVSKCISI